MSFNSYEFILFFLFACVLYYLVPYYVRNLFLLVISYFFYMCWGLKYALWLAGATLISYVFGRWIFFTGKQQMRKVILGIGIGLHLGFLFFFKYADFLLETFGKISGKFGGQAPAVLGFVAPMGISFYTFQVVGYLIDVYRGKHCEKNLLKYALFVSFFPKIAQGPIERGDHFLKQLDQPTSFSIQRIGEGLLRMLYGYFQKMVIADNLAVAVNEVYGNYPLYGAFELITATLYFAVQIYCDFAGYTNIAIGAAKVLGFDLLENFDTPYFAISVSDFWRRWHMSLTNWFRDYLYIPLGGNRKGRLRRYVNIMIVFLLSGLWHGASWHYAAWGGLNGLYQIIGDLLQPLRDRFCRAFHVDRQVFSHRLGSGLITFVLICISWVFFRANSMRDSFSILKGMITKWDPWFLVNDGLYKLGIGPRMTRMLFVAVFVMLVVDLLHVCGGSVIARFKKQGIWLKYLLIFSLLVWVLVCGSYGTGYDASAFLYTQF